MPSLPTDVIALPLLPHSFVRSSPQRMYKDPHSSSSSNLFLLSPGTAANMAAAPLLLSRDDDNNNSEHENIHDESVVEIYNHMTEWKKILLWVALAAAVLFLVSILLCLCHCCCRRRHEVKGAADAAGPKHLDNSYAASTVSNISGPLNVAAPRALGQSVSPGSSSGGGGGGDSAGMVDVSLKTPGPNGPAGRQYGYGMLVNTQRNITGLAPAPQQTATYGNMPADLWKSPADRFGGPSASYMS